MSEIRLICPGCGAEYRLPQDAIPAVGREVECSACARVWTATAPTGGPRLDLGAFAAAEKAADEAAPTLPSTVPATLPPPSRRLPPDVLNILREEVEHERRLRAAEAGDRPIAAAPDPAGTEADWPATTVTLPAGTARAMMAAPQPQPPQLDLAADPAILQPQATERPDPAPVEKTALLRAESPLVIRHPSPPRPTFSPRAKTGNAGYRTGFGLAVMVAASCAALYLLAPGLADSGNAFGEHLMDLRQEVDRGRLWLQDQARGLTG